MSVRVIAGSLRGRRLHVPDQPGVRPTTDRARETLFNVLAPRIVGARFLDAFAGSGAVGIEALSRGAAMVTFVERNRASAAVIEANLKHCGLAADDTPPPRNADVLVMPWRAALERLRVAGARYDIAFFDPPYDGVDANSCLADFAAANVLQDGGIAVIEHRKSRPIEAPGDWLLQRRIDVSDSTFSLFAP